LLNDFVVLPDGIDVGYDDEPPKLVVAARKMGLDI
jgi:hypothetical protein